MKNFRRAIAIAFRHRFTVTASLVCSLAVAILWGGNITAIYPVVDIVMNNKSVPQYLDEQRRARRRADRRARTNRRKANARARRPAHRPGPRPTAPAQFA